MIPPASPHLRFLCAAPRPIGAALLRGWRGTGFEAGGAVGRLGRRSPGMDAVLAAAGVRQAVVLGAWNPASRRWPARRNVAMQARLMLRARRLRVLEALGRPARGAWKPEPHLVVPGDARPAIRLARVFRQHAVLRLRLRAPAVLLVLR
ncbi:DUF3293 domain-containing protein [Roseomonas sp. HF4]|uniref:DUF3293 domain-containing protein n=1 Tax=Roseomonas sp. HF4 TaxID=2562313 RepID=UPI0010BF6D30|nr:DUF3293 domain-containing protein [Roseomonas sp. HF4]